MRRLLLLTTLLSSPALADDDEFVIERERVEGEVDHALDGVLDRDEAVVDGAGADRVQHVGHRPHRSQFPATDISLRPEGLLGERPERPEERDRRSVGSSLRCLVVLHGTQATGASRRVHMFSPVVTGAVTRGHTCSPVVAGGHTWSSVVTRGHTRSPSV